LYFGKYFHILIIISGVLVRLPLVSLPLNVYGTDGWRQADTASIARHFFLNGYRILYPQIYWGGNGPGYVETEFQLYPFSVSLLYAVFGEQVWLGRLVSLLATAVAFFLFFRLAKLMFPDGKSALWALAFLVFSPLYIRYSVAFMPEATVMLFYIAALFFFYQWAQNQKAGFLVASSVCIAMALLVKPTSIHIGLVLALFAIDRLGFAVLKKKEIWLALLISLLPSLFWYWHARDLYLEYGNTFGLLSGGDSKFGNLSVWLSPSFYASLARLELKWIFAAIAIVPFLIGIFLCLKQKSFRINVYGFITVGIYYMIVARYARQEWGIQYHVYMLPYAALCVGLGMDWLLRQSKSVFSRYALGAVSLLFFLASAYFYKGMLTPVQDGLAQCASYVQALVPSGDRIVASTTSVADDNGVANNYQEPQIFYYSQRYGWSLPADWHTAEKIIEYRNAGAHYFVIYDRELLENNPALRNYLKNNSIQVGPGIEYNCAIYRFN
jgi:hypothetical protein